jgi:hypothetical protein
MEFAPSETVVLHPLRFVEPMRSGQRPVPRAVLGRAAGIAAVVAGAATGSLRLEPRAIPILALLPGAGRRLRAFVGSDVLWPEGSLEEALQRVIGAAPEGIDLDDALRGALSGSGRLVPDVVAFVEGGLVHRGIALPSEGDPAAADAVHSLLSDFREHDPDRWIAIARDVDRALWLPLLRDAIRSRTDDITDPRHPRRERARDYLKSWRRLNRDPPSAR